MPSFAATTTAVVLFVLNDEPDAAFAGYIREKIHLLKRLQTSGKVGNRTEFLMEAIRKNYANPAFVEEQRRRTSEGEQKAKRERERKIQALERQKAEIEKDRDNAVKQLCEQIAQESPEVMDQALAILLEENYLFRQLYVHEKTPVENYRSRPMLQMGFDPYLERQDPTRFEAVKRDYARRIAVLDDQIAACKQRGS